MQISQNYISHLIYFLCLLFLFTSISINAQIIEVETNNQTPLQKISKVIISDNETALRIFISNSVFTEVILRKADNEDVIVFSVYNHSALSATSGKLFVSKSSLTYIPDQQDKVSKKKGFKIEQAKLSNLELKPSWRFCGACPNVSLEFPGEKKHFSLISAVNWNDRFEFYLEKYSVDGTYNSIANEFLYLVIKDFDRGLTVFNNLTFEAQNRINAEKEAQKRNQIEGAEKVRKQQALLEDRLRIAQVEAVKRKEYEEKVTKAIQEGKPQNKSISPQIKTKVEIALKSLRRMSAATDIGVNISDYNNRLIDTKVEVDEAIEILDEGFLKEELRLSLQAFIDSGRAWNEMGKFDFLSLDNEISWILISRYGLQPQSKGSINDLLPKDYVLSTIWIIASSHLKNASDLASK